MKCSLPDLSILQGMNPRQLPLLTTFQYPQNTAFKGHEHVNKIILRNPVSKNKRMQILIIAMWT